MCTLSDKIIAFGNRVRVKIPNAKLRIRYFKIILIFLSATPKVVTGIQFVFSPNSPT